MYNADIMKAEVTIMLFRKKITHSCAYCVHGTRLEAGNILCIKKGFRDENEKCFRFRYDPCKRIPVKARALDLTRYQEEDYSL